MAGTLYAGASGFSYPSWRGGFYPPDARPADFLAHYAARLPAVELNVTFYRLPAEEQFASWAAATPRGFRFAVKASRGITHGGRLDRVAVFAERVRGLGDRLGPVRVQLPETRPRDDGFLRFLLDTLDPDLPVALEPLHPSWDDPEVDEVLAARGAARVGSLAGAAPFRYVRLREPPYSEEELAALARAIAPALAAGVDVYAFFRHEDEPTAPAYASRLLELAS